jgi:ABC-type antimicrobial peptide transport system permease subunit
LFGPQETPAQLNVKLDALSLQSITTFLSQRFKLSRSRFPFSFQSRDSERSCSACFSILALLLAAVGIYGVLSQRVAQRTQEIGIRVALGARRDDVMKLIIGEGLRLTFIGIAIGIAGSVALARFLSRDQAAKGAGWRPSS